MPAAMPITSVFFECKSDGFAGGASSFAARVEAAANSFTAAGGGAVPVAPSVNRIVQRGHVSTAPGGTCVGSNRNGQLGFGHFSAVAIADPSGSSEIGDADRL